jgi:hypothetical protein
MVVWIGSRSFATKKKAEKYVRRLITNGNREELLIMLRQHPQADQKLANLVDLRIHPETFTIDVVNADDSVINIPWLHCINPRPLQYYWHKALKQSVWPQIEAFKLAHPTETCSACEEKIFSMHVEHSIPTLVQAFHLLVPMPFDAETMETPSGETYFAAKHVEYEKQWQKYFQEQAALRIICEHCNVNLN